MVPPPRCSGPVSPKPWSCRRSGCSSRRSPTAAASSSRCRAASARTGPATPRASRCSTHGPTGSRGIATRWATWTSTCVRSTSTPTTTGSRFTERCSPGRSGRSRGSVRGRAARGSPLGSTSAPTRTCSVVPVPPRARGRRHARGVGVAGHDDRTPERAGESPRCVRLASLPAAPGHRARRVGARSARAGQRPPQRARHPHRSRPPGGGRARAAGRSGPRRSLRAQCRAGAHPRGRGSTADPHL